MSEITFRCGDAEILVAYLYGEASPGERRAVAAHLNQCTFCEAEVADLTATREQLAAWRPPEAALGFHVDGSGLGPSAVAGASVDGSRVDRSGVDGFGDGVGTIQPVARAWWREPMPAWMQVAAAALVFAAGLAVGTARPGVGGVPAPTVATTSPAASAASGLSRLNGDGGAGAGAASSAPGEEAATRNELARVEAGLRSEMAAMRVSTSTVPTARRDDETVMKQVRVLLQESEARQQRELALRTAQVIRDFEIQRRLDMMTVRQTIGQVEGAAGAELRRQQEMWTALASRVGQSGPAR